MTSQRLKQFLGGLDDLPALPAIAARLVSVTGDPQTSPLDVARVIESDPALTSKVLHLANSASIGLSHDVATVEHAASLLGLDVLRNMALSLVLVNLFEAENPQGLDARGFWQHSLACGLAAELMAKPLGFPRPKEAFVAGLLHDLGKVIFYYWDTEAYNQVVQRARSSLTPLLEVEEETLEFGHTLAAKLVMEYWNFPAALVSAAWLHHQPLLAMGKKPSEQLPFLVKCANTLCHLHQYGDSGHFWPEWDEQELLQISGLKSHQLRQISRLTFDRLSEISSLFNWENSSAELYLDAVARINSQLTGIKTELSSRRQDENSRSSLFKSQNLLLSILEEPRSVVVALEKTLEYLSRSVPCEKLLIFLVEPREQVVSTLLRSPDGNQSQFTSFAMPAELLNAASPLKQFSEFEELVRRQIESQPGAREIAEFLRQTNLVELPLKIGNRLLGQIVLRPEISFPISKAIGEGLVEYARTAALVLGHLLRFEHLTRQAEFIARTARESEREHFHRYQSRRLESVGRLAAGAAHEINNPLSVILGKAQLGLERAQDSEIRETLKIICEQSQKISKVIEEMMGLTRPSEPNHALTSLTSLLEKSIGPLQNRLKTRGIELISEVPDDIPKFVTDPVQLEQVFINLILNGIYSMPNGGKLTIRASVLPEQGSLVIQFADTGPGLKGTKLKSLFDPFYKTEDVQEGTGLGLSICHAIVESQGGTIRVQSQGKEGEDGTVFTVTLPLTSIEKIERVYLEGPQPPDFSLSPCLGEEQGKNPSILIVDDEESLASMLLEIFRRDGYQVETALNGLEGLEKISRRSFDVVLLDLRMPGKNGIEVLESIRGMKPSPPVIVISGIPSQEELERAKAAGAMVCLKKPFDLEELSRLVRKAAEEKPTIH